MKFCYGGLIAETSGNIVPLGHKSFFNFVYQAVVPLGH